MKTNTIRGISATMVALTAVVLVFLLCAVVASADDGSRRGGDDVSVKNTSIGVSMNMVGASAVSGDASARGGDGGDATAQNGGAQAGDGARGGTAVSGDAAAWASVENYMLGNRTVIDTDPQASEGRGRHGESVDVSVRNTDMGLTLNLVGASAVSGDASARGGDGGDARARAMHRWHACAMGGDGAPAGTARTGTAYADASVVNVMGGHVTRIGGIDVPETPDPD